jgi:hypothetical protein
MGLIFSPTFATATLANAQGHALRWFIIAIASAVYFFINRSRRKKLVAGIDSDHRIAGSFEGAVMDFPAPEEESPWGYGWLWVGIIVAFGGLLMIIGGTGGFVVAGAVLMVGGLGLAVYDYHYGLSKSAPEDCLTKAEFSFGRIVLIRRITGRTEHVFGPGLGVTVDCREVTEKSFGADALTGYGIYLNLPSPSCEVPLDFAGAAEFLGFCRHQGSPVVFSSSCPSWFKVKMEALPSWQPGYFQG